MATKEVIGLVRQMGATFPDDQLNAMPDSEAWQWILDNLEAPASMDLDGHKTETTREDK